MYENARLKLHRAEKHIADLTTAIDSLPHRYTSSIEIDPNIPAQSIKYDFPGIAPFLTEVALITGDVIHNLRTAVDYAWIDTVKRVAPSAIIGSAKFPIRRTATEAEAALRGAKIDVASPPLFDCVLSQIKPHLGGDDALVMLHALYIADKHKLLLPIINVAGINGIEVENESGKPFKGDTNPIHGVGPYYVDFLMDYRIKNKGELTIFVEFDEESGVDPSMERADVADTLLLFSKIALNVVGRLECVR